jgi:hypothetical protein
MFFDRLLDFLEAIGGGDVIGVLAHQPGCFTLAQHAVEREGEPAVLLLNQAKPRVANGVQVLKAAIGRAVDDREQLEISAGLAQDAFDGLPQVGHGVKNGKSDRQQPALQNRVQIEPSLRPLQLSVRRDVRTRVLTVIYSLHCILREFFRSSVKLT